MKAHKGKNVCFKILFHAFSERRTELSGAKCERNTMTHCGRGGDRGSMSGVHREGKQHYSEAPTQSTKSAVAHWLSHGNHCDNLTPVDQTALRTDCTRCCRADHCFWAVQRTPFSTTGQLVYNNVIQSLKSVFGGTELIIQHYRLLPLLSVLEIQMSLSFLAYIKSANTILHHMWTIVQSPWQKFKNL